MDELSNHSYHNHTMTFGPLTEYLLQVFNTCTDPGILYLTEPGLTEAFNNINIYPSKSQVRDMLRCSGECSKRSLRNRMSFGEFCVFSQEFTELYREEERSIRVREQKSRIRPLRHRRSKKFSKSRLMGPFQVFLGGSCNPTEWREEIAIPLLKQHRITYYNPQINYWGKTQLDVEQVAKQMAELFLFYINNKTRSVASMIEIAFLSGGCKPLIPVIEGEFQHGLIIDKDRISDVELDDLKRGRIFMCDLVERKGIPIFDNIDRAIECAVKVLKHGKRVTELGKEDGAQPVRFAHIRVGDQLKACDGAFHDCLQYNTDTLSVEGSIQALISITNEDVEPSTRESILTSSKPQQYRLNFDNFCSLSVEQKKTPESPVSLIRWISVKFLLGLWWIFGWMRGGGVGTDEESEDEEMELTIQCNIFLGGSCGQADWREKLAVPMLRKHGLTYFNPQLSEWNLKFIPLEAEAKMNCDCLLFVITGDSRAVASMIEVAHYIGEGRTTVLCVQEMKPGTVIQNEPMTQSAIEDYNRGRNYLADIANRSQVPVFGDVQEAIVKTIEIVKDNRRQRNNNNRH